VFFYILLFILYIKYYIEYINIIHIYIYIILVITHTRCVCVCVCMCEIVVYMYIKHIIIIRFAGDSYLLNCINNLINRDFYTIISIISYNGIN